MKITIKCYYFGDLKYNFLHAMILLPGFLPDHYSELWPIAHMPNDLRISGVEHLGYLVAITLKWQHLTHGLNGCLVSRVNFDLETSILWIFFEMQMKFPKQMYIS